MALAPIIQRTDRMEPSSGRWGGDRWIEPESSTNDPALERHYSVNVIAASWGLSGNTIRRMFENEPGVIEWVQQRAGLREAIALCEYRRASCCASTGVCESRNQIVSPPATQSALHENAVDNHCNCSNFLLQ